MKNGSTVLNRVQQLQVVTSTCFELSQNIGPYHLLRGDTYNSAIKFVFDFYFLCTQNYYGRCAVLLQNCSVNFSYDIFYKALVISDLV